MPVRRKLVTPGVLVLLGLALTGLTFGLKRFGRLRRLAKFAYGKVERVMFVLIIAGCTLSCLHQSSLGNLMVIPLVMFASGRVRRSPRLLLVAASLVVLGVVFNRVNVFLIGYHPPYATRAYFPSVGEFAVTIGLFAALMLCYRVIVTYLRVISQPKAEAAI